MSKKQNGFTVIDAEIKNENVSLLEINQAQRDYATAHGLDLNASAEARWKAAVKHQDAAKKHFAALGLVMLSLKADLPHGEFQCEVEARGFELRQTQLAMGYARFVFSRSKVEQAELLKLGHTKVCKLAAADPEVIELVLQDGVEVIDAASMRQFARKIEELTNTVERLQNAAEARTSQQDVEALGHIVSPDIPYHVSDIRRETAALYKQAELAVASLADLGPMLLDLQGVAKMDKWLAPTATQAYTAMQGLHAKLAVQMAAWRDTFALEVEGLPPIVDAAFYRPEEAVLVATHFESLTATHLAEGKKRADIRANAVVGKRGAKRKVD